MATNLSLPSVRVQDSPWVRTLTWFVWLAILLAPLAVMIHWEATVAAPSRADTDALLKKVDAQQKNAQDFLDKEASR